MNIITSSNNLISNEWSVEVSKPIYTYADLSIGFTNNQPTVYFNNLRFGYELIGPLETIVKNYPLGNTIYNSTDEPYLTIDRLDFAEDTNYNLHLWCENNNIYSETTISFKTDILPPAPSPTPQPTPIPSGSTMN
jgi:hypothetical protein